jgi:hypothetical protein
VHDFHQVLFGWLKNLSGSPFLVYWRRSNKKGDVDLFDMELGLIPQRSPAPFFFFSLPSLNPTQPKLSTEREKVG